MVRLRNIYYPLILIPLCFLLVGCPEEGVYNDSFYMLTNNSIEKIVWYEDISLNVTDTALRGEIPWIDVKNYLLMPGDSTISYFNKENMQRSFNSHSSHFYFINYDTLNKYLWGEIRDGYKIVKRVDIETYEEFESMDRTITYP